MSGILVLPAKQKAAPPELASVQPPQFETHLKLSEERLTWLEDRISTRISEMMTESGLDADGQAIRNTFLGIRECHQLTYDGDLRWRQLELLGIFQQSNLTLGTTKRYVREMAAKVSDDLLGTSPFFAATKVSDSTAPDVTKLASATEEFIQSQVDRSNIQTVLSEAERVALIRNEAVVKLRYIRRSSFFWGAAKVLVGTSGEPIITPTGLMVYENDDFLPDPNMPGVFRLRKDPSFAMQPGEFQYQNFPSLRQEEISYEGIEGAVVDYRSFLCSLRVPSIHEADVCCQLFDEDSEVLAQTYQGFSQFDRYSAWQRDSETSGERQPIRSQGERDDDQRSSVLNRVSMAEVYIRCDADQDGTQEEIFAVYDRDAKRIVFCEYLFNMMPKRPFEVVPGIEKMPNRWYGVGIMHMLFDTNNYIDAQFNRYNVKDSREASVTFRDPMAVKEWKAGVPTEFGTNTVYDLEPGFDHENRPPIFRINLAEAGEIGLKLMEKAEQSANLQFGVISAKDASSNNLNQSRTATGILSLERTANVLTRYTEAQHITAIQDALEQVTDLILENMRPMELFFSKDESILHSLSRDEVRDLQMDVRLLLTRSRSTELLATNQQALGIAKDYHAVKAQSPQTARDLRPLYVNELKGLEVEDADDLLPIVTDQEIAAWQQAQQKAAQQQNKEPNPREWMSYKDASPPIRRQMEVQAGLTPLSPEDSAKYEPPEAPAAVPTKQPEPKPPGQ